MNWQEYISIKLNLHENANKIILDKTGLIKSDAFISHLKSNNKNFYISRSILEILKILNRNENAIIITDLPLVSLPSSVQQKSELIVFNYSDLPFNLPSQFYERLTIDEIIKSLEYIVHKNIKIDILKKYTIKDILNEASKFSLNAHYSWHLEMLAELLNQEINYNSILQIGYSFGYLNYLAWLTHQKPKDELLEKVDSNVSQYILSDKLKNAFYEPLSTFKTVDKIRNYIKSQQKQKIALICFDGMGVAEWFLLKDYLKQGNFSFNERFVFSMIPSNTLISRSAIFYGNLETVYNLSYSNEEKELNEYFENYFVKFYRQEDHLDHKNLLGVDFVCIIYNIFDDIAHNTQLPPDNKNKNIYFINVRNYLEKSKILNSINTLVKNKYHIYICSDHGCVVARGNNQKIDKWLQDQYCKRACIVKNDELIQNLNHLDCDRIEIPFDNTRLVLLAKNRTMFDSDKKIGITHGGITVEEIVVPFIEVNA
ncbi:MAG: PglZ domain-containing protein [Candidatus Lokiarchaeota archaeon]|nr:PglZ domain-containing protein [Candidatus Lokiarchaeota archaeon]